MPQHPHLKYSKVKAIISYEVFHIIIYTVLLLPNFDVVPSRASDSPAAHWMAPHSICDRIIFCKFMFDVGHGSLDILGCIATGYKTGICYMNAGEMWV